MRSDPQELDCISAIVLRHHFGIKHSESTIANQLAVRSGIKVAEEHRLP
jgi:hypothetical protein